jgi:hypothetical protein
MADGGHNTHRKDREREDRRQKCEAEREERREAREDCLAIAEQMAS